MTAPNIVTRWPGWAPYLLSIQRIVAAFVFMQVGSAKLFAFPPRSPALVPSPVPQHASQRERRGRLPRAGD